MHLHVVEYDHALGDQLVELREERVDSLGGVDDDNRDGQVLGQAEGSGTVRYGRPVGSPVQVRRTGG